MRRRITKKERNETMVSSFMKQYAAALDAGTDVLMDEVSEEKFPPELDQRCRALIQQATEKKTVKELRAKTGLSQSQFAKHFYPPIPLRTLQHWEQGRQEPPDYVVGMMERILELEKEKTL